MSSLNDRAEQNRNEHRRSEKGRALESRGEQSSEVQMRAEEIRENMAEESVMGENSKNISINYYLTKNNKKNGPTILIRNDVAKSYA